MAKISDVEVPSLLFDEQASAPATPATGFWRAYFKATGLHVVDDAGTETGPLGTGGGGGDVATDTIWNAAGDLAVGSGADTAAVLSMGTALQVLRVNAAGTALEWADPTGGGASLPVQSQSQNSSGLTTASTTYTSGDVLGAGWTFTSMAQSSGGGGRITGAKLLDKADVVTGVELWLASASITFGTDNAAPSISDTDAEKLLGVIPLAALDLGGSRTGVIGNLAIPYLCDATSLFVYAITRADHSFFAAATDLRVTLFFERD